MANSFKSSSKANVGTGITTVYKAAISGTETKKTSVILGITLSNTLTTNITASVFINRPSSTGTANEPREDVYIVRNAIIPAGSSIEIMSGNKLILQYFGSPVNDGDAIQAVSSDASSLDVMVSYLEVT